MIPDGNRPSEENATKREPGFAAAGRAVNVTANCPGGEQAFDLPSTLAGWNPS
jgi:hypothetical protein